MRWAWTWILALCLMKAESIEDRSLGDGSRDTQCGAPELLAVRDGVRLYSVENFLSGETCVNLLNARRRFMSSVESNPPLICFQDVNTMAWYGVDQWDLVEGTMCVNSTLSARLLGTLPPDGRPITRQINYSTSLSFYTGTRNLIGDAFSSRLDALISMLPFGEFLQDARGGKYQLTHYAAGQGYARHTDCTIGGHNKRDRAATILVYLEDVEDGGETVFPALGVAFKPKRGTALIFNGMDASGICLGASIHEARPVKEGSREKAVLQRWYYYETFPTLGKAVPPPELPPRTPGQARIQCDGVGENFCRLYDEWVYDHLIDYRRGFGMTRGLPDPAARRPLTREATVGDSLGVDIPSGQYLVGDEVDNDVIPVRNIKRKRKKRMDA